jgi:serine/threonine-protein kinase
MNSPLQQDNWLGRNIGDRQRYRLEQHLGSGGMGDVFVARDTLLGKQVALKLLKDTLVESPALRKRFEREVALCAALKSDHIVSISDYGVTTDGYPFYVMEYLRGQSLKQLLQQQQRLSLEQTARIIAQVCEALRLAHEGVTLWQNGATANKQIKIVHRDLKPDNIFLVPTGLGELVKVLDFGIAKICNDTTEHTNLTNMFVGTFHYASPEQFEFGADIDERADIYSLGIILYEMLSGTDPFGLGANINQNVISGMSWVFAHASKPPIPLRSQQNLLHFSPQLEAVVMRCLQKLPERRFASVDELNRALQAAVTFEHRDSSTAIPIPLTSQPSFDQKKINQTQTPSEQAIPEPTIIELPPSPGTACESNTNNRSLNTFGQGVSELSLLPEQRSLLEIFTEFAGPIAASLFRQVFTPAASTRELVENLAFYLSPRQRIEFEKRVKALQGESTIKPKVKPNTVKHQVESNNSFRLNQPVVRADFIHQCERELVDLIGPIANFLIQKVLKSHPQISAGELVNLLAGEIPDPKKANDFCRRLLK